MLNTKVLAAVAVTLLLLGGASAQTTREETARTSSAAAPGSRSQRMTITRSGERTSARGPEATFTGTVSVEPLFPSNAPARTSGARVTFEPGARSNWHTHPLGQTLIVTEGTGWVQEEGGERRKITAGDVVWTPPGVRHWHGAMATRRMTHIAIQEALDGKVVEWFEKVTDEQYGT